MHTGANGRESLSSNTAFESTARQSEMVALVDRSIDGIHGDRANDPAMDERHPLPVRAALVLTSAALRKFKGILADQGVH